MYTYGHTVRVETVQVYMYMYFWLFPWYLFSVVTVLEGDMSVCCVPIGQYPLLMSYDLFTSIQEDAMETVYGMCD